MYKNVSEQEMLTAIDNGWYPTWFAVENSKLMVDLCVNYRLTDGKVLFLQFYSTDTEELFRVADEVAKKAKETWNKTIDKMANSLIEQKNEVTQAAKIIASIEWKEGQKYLFTYSNDKAIYQCVTALDQDIYLVKIPNGNEYRYDRSEKSVRDIVSRNTKIELMD